MPEPGPYRPLPWAHPRPWTLWAYLALFVVGSVFYFLVIYKGNGNFLIGIIELAILFFLWRGSRIAWIVTIVLTAIAVAVELGFTFKARAPGGHEPWMHAVSLIQYTAMFILLLLPPTRRFYDLRTRQVRSD